MQYESLSILERKGFSGSLNVCSHIPDTHRKKTALIKSLIYVYDMHITQMSFTVQRIFSYVFSKYVD